MKQIPRSPERYTTMAFEMMPDKIVRFAGTIGLKGSFQTDVAVLLKVLDLLG